MRDEVIGRSVGNQPIGGPSSQLARLETDWVFWLAAFRTADARWTKIVQEDSMLRSFLTPGIFWFLFYWKPQQARIYVDCCCFKSIMLSLFSLSFFSNGGGVYKKIISEFCLPYMLSSSLLICVCFFKAFKKSILNNITCGIRKFSSVFARAGLVVCVLFLRACRFIYIQTYTTQFANSAERGKRYIYKSR